MNKKATIKKAIQNSVSAKQAILADDFLIDIIEKISEEFIRAFQNEKKVLLCGNGGSAADAQHLAAEFSGRFYKNRKPLFAEALHVNTSYLTAVANDYSYEQVFSRMVETMGKDGDVLVGISTSGSSKNVIKALQMAKNLGMVTVGFTGQRGSAMKDICQYAVVVPSADTPRIQEAHMLIGHIIAEIVEKELFG